MKRNDDIIVVRRAEAEEEAKKGGVWKIAHADFMTAMMAFFLIMWLVNATDEEIKKSIANYFNPMNLMASPTDRRGLIEPTEMESSNAAGSEDGGSEGNGSGAGRSGEGSSSPGGGNVEEGNENTMASAGILQETDNAAFNDPYAELASAASDIDPEDPTAVDVPQSTLGVTGTTMQSEDVRDPFDPAYWQTVRARAPQTLRPGRDTADTLPPDSVIDSAAARPRGELADPPANAAGTTTIEIASDDTGTRSEHVASRNAAGPRSQLAEQILREEAERERSASPAPNAAPEMSAAQSARDELSAALEGANADVEVTAGERSVTISLTDDNDFSMFAIGSAEPTASARDLLRRVGEVLSEREGRIVVRGHTDARPFLSGGSDNWVLSFERAHATKSQLVANGVEERRFLRVEGLADREPSHPDDPLADENRRIEILYEPSGGAE